MSKKDKWAVYIEDQLTNIMANSASHNIDDVITKAMKEYELEDLRHHIRVAITKKEGK